MTQEERKNPDILKNSRKVRIAKGSGTTAQDINRLLKQFEDMKKMMKQMPGMMKSGKLPGGGFPGGFKR
jgi:signal recognition particle subunit SRP54